MAEVRGASFELRVFFHVIQSFILIRAVIMGNGFPDLRGKKIIKIYAQKIKQKFAPPKFHTNCLNTKRRAVVIKIRSKSSLCHQNP